MNKWLFKGCPPVLDRDIGFVVSLSIMMKKHCLSCGKLLTPKHHEIHRPSHFAKRKYCDKTCANTHTFSRKNVTFRGRNHSPNAIEKCRMAKLAEKNPMWKGDKVGYAALHDWVKLRKAKPTLCEICSNAPPFDLTSINDSYTRNPDDWQWLCRRCHMLSDGRLENLVIIANQNRGTIPREQNGRFGKINR